MIRAVLVDGPGDEGVELRLPFITPPPTVQQTRENRLAEYAYTNAVDEHGRRVYELRSELVFTDLPEEK
jgi:hypothetical protein